MQPTAATTIPAAMRREPSVPLRAKIPVGGFAGMLATSLIFPLDTVKTLLQDHGRTSFMSRPHGGTSS